MRTELQLKVYLHAAKTRALGQTIMFTSRLIDIRAPANALQNVRSLGEVQVTISTKDLENKE